MSNETVVVEEIDQSQPTDTDTTQTGEEQVPEISPELEAERHKVAQLEEALKNAAASQSGADKKLRDALKEIEEVVELRGGICPHSTDFTLDAWIKLDGETVESIEDVEYRCYPDGIK